MLFWNLEMGDPAFEFQFAYNSTETSFLLFLKVPIKVIFFSKRDFAKG
jgi:hypothetical protein